MHNFVKGSTDLLIIGFSRLRLFLISTYNIRFNESNVRLVDLSKK